MRILRGSEDYLETMLVLREQKGYIRSVDVANVLNVTKPSVTYTTKRLRESGHITMEKDGRIILTRKGLNVAKKTMERHNTLVSFLVKIGVDEKIAAEDACRISHNLSDETFAAMASQLENK